MRAPKIAVAVLCGLLGSTAAALAHDTTRPCDDPLILKQISERFRNQSFQLNKRLAHIRSFENIHEHRSMEKSEFSPIARRYCGATAAVSNGRHHEVWYLIEGHAGFAGVANGVEFCVSGFDRWNVYNAACRVLR